MLKFVFLGDIVGRAGRESVLNNLPLLQDEFKPDYIAINIENAARGFGVTPKICKELFDAGVSVLTSGNHMWDNRDIIPYISDERRLIRPANYPDNNPGQGTVLTTTAKGKKILTINLMGTLLMLPVLECPFAKIEQILKKYVLGQNVDAIFVDFHAETTSEKQAMGRLLDGRVTAVVGTHTHVPTADERILPKGTAYQSDAGMCGNYNSVLGMKAEISIQRFVRKFSDQRLEPAEGEGTICGLYIEADNNGLATKVHRIQMGAKI